jgi:hypothetical protein
MLYNTATYNRVRAALTSGEFLTLDTDTMEILDFNAVGQAMFDHVSNLRGKGAN